ncbi:hypothetical protein SEA_SPIKELEE_82 [Mycobacterium phage Spikelee]|uniref:Uncharacterized protein n=1 Tax=Mycobacterium phage Spikelee TaxID=2301571 RepID=A0A385DS61_9CAUD|nr:hypothetical protein I5H90_gp082 [Mycobacterium phage Spikelee]AXQ62211.1 hypothetical protein SEA_SPIKELEE_82 [Mycobacterium phage Spikelee]
MPDRSSFHEARVRAAELAATGALTRGRMSLAPMTRGVP